MSWLINDTKNEFENDKNFLDHKPSSACFGRTKPKICSDGHSCSSSQKEISQLLTVELLKIVS